MDSPNMQCIDPEFILLSLEEVSLNLSLYFSC